MPVPPQSPLENRTGPATPAVVGAGRSRAADAHAVQFYEDDDFLCAAASQFLAAGLVEGQPFIVVATHQHRDGIACHLTARGFDVERLRLQGRALWLDVEETLATFTLDGRIDLDLFKGSIGGILDKIGGPGGRPVRAYGEIVDVLCRAGRAEDALAVEAFWNELAADRPLLMLCGYAMGHFCLESQGAQFQEVCRQHSHVAPTERYSRAADDGTRLREISVLQQRARALETEIARRAELERALTQALADRARAEGERERLLALERAARETAETASRLKDEFLAVLSHELRTPLNAILGWTQIASRSETDASTTQRALDVIQRNANSQLHVIEDLLDVSRIVTGKMVIATDRVDLADVLGSAIETIRPAAAGKSIDLALDVGSTGRFVRGDAHRLQQVLWNLLSNAVKFTPSRGSVRVELQEADGHARIAIRDTGQGIDAAFLPHVFDRFRQQDSGTARQYGGLGLGLSVVRYLVEAHGGTVAVESEGEGRGARFVITLPLAAAEAPAAQARPERPVALRGVRVLVVDDQRDARDLFNLALKQAGAVVETAASVGDALQALASHPFDVLIGDIGMPGQDGYALIEGVRNHPDARVRRLTAVAVTSYAGEHHRGRALASGYDEYLAKPVDPALLTRTVTDALHGTRTPGH